MVRGGRAEAPFDCSDVSFRLDQKTGNFKVLTVSTDSRVMQRGPLTEEKQKNELAKTEFRFIRPIMIIGGGNYFRSFASVSALHMTLRLAC